MTEGLSRRAMLVRLSAAALLAAGGCGRPSSGSSKVVHIATAAGGLNQTMSELLHQQKFLESFDLTPDVVAMADGTKILGGIYSGSIDVSPMSGFGQVFPAVEHGADLKIINAATLIPAQALFSAKPNVRSLHDLEGKVVGVGSVAGRAGKQPADRGRRLLDRRYGGDCAGSADWTLSSGGRRYRLAHQCAVRDAARGCDPAGDSLRSSCRRPFPT